MRDRSDEKPSPPPEDVWLGANRAIASAMSFVLPLWNVPLPANIAPTCSASDAAMARYLLRTFGRDATEGTVHAFYARFRRRYSFVELTAAIARAGRAAQLLETYAFGRFVLLAAQRCVDPADLTSSSAVLDEIDAELWDAAGVIAFYEQSSDTPFPAKAVARFTTTVAALRRMTPRPTQHVWFPGRTFARAGTGGTDKRWN
jgi:hypothetical protein